MPLWNPFTCPTTVVSIFETVAFSDLTSPRKPHIVPRVSVARGAMSEIEVHTLLNFCSPLAELNKRILLNARRSIFHGCGAKMCTLKLPSLIRFRRRPFWYCGQGLFAGPRDALRADLPRSSASRRTGCKRSEPTPHLPNIDRWDTTPMATCIGSPSLQGPSGWARVRWTGSLKIRGNLHQIESIAISYPAIPKLRCP